MGTRADCSCFSAESEILKRAPPVIDEYRIFIQAVGGEKKNIIYGLGSEASAFFSGPSITVQSPGSQAIKDEINRRVDMILNERMTQHMHRMDAHFDNRVQQAVLSFIQASNSSTSPSTGTPVLNQLSRFLYQYCDILCMWLFLDISFYFMYSDDMYCI